MARKKMTDEELAAWDALYQYVKTIMGYDENQALSKDMVLRLKGLLTGKFMENNSVQDNANYSYEVILNTFKYCRQSIQSVFNSKSFANEMYKFNYMLVIVEKNINTVYMRMKAAEKAKEDAKNTMVEAMNHTGAEYQRKSKELTNKLLDDLW